jgi:ABC-type polysaccharide/polyol phosphate export permease
MQSSVVNLWHRRHLLWVLTSSNLKRQNKNSALGYLWWLLDPIMMTGVYFILVVVLFERGGDNQPFILFILCGLLPWKAFSTSVSQSINSIAGQASIIRSIGFPKIVLPTSLVLSNTVFLAIGLTVVALTGLYFGSEYGTWPNVYYLMLPVVIGLQLLFTLGVALVMSAVGVLFKDTGNIMRHILRMWYFLSPGLYSLERIPGHLLPIFRLNPFAELMTAYRDIIMHGRMPALFDLAYPLVIGVVSLLAGFWIVRPAGRHLLGGESPLQAR